MLTRSHAALFSSLLLALALALALVLQHAKWISARGEARSLRPASTPQAPTPPEAIQQSSTTLQVPALWHCYTAIWQHLHLLLCLSNPWILTSASSSSHAPFPSPNEHCSRLLGLAILEQLLARRGFYRRMRYVSHVGACCLVLACCLHAVSSRSVFVRLPCNVLMLYYRRTLLVPSV